MLELKYNQNYLYEGGFSMPNYRKSGLLPVVTYLKEDEKRAVEVLASRENRSLANLLRTLVINKAKEEGLIEKNS